MKTLIKAIIFNVTILFSFNATSWTTNNVFMCGQIQSVDICAPETSCPAYQLKKWNNEIFGLVLVPPNRNDRHQVDVADVAEVSVKLNANTDAEVCVLGSLVDRYVEVTEAYLVRKASTQQ